MYPDHLWTDYIWVMVYWVWYHLDLKKQVKYAVSMHYRDNVMEEWAKSYFHLYFVMSRLEEHYVCVLPRQRMCKPLYC